MARVTAVAFDLGGVLVSDVQEALFAALTRRHRLDAEKARRVRRDLWQTYTYRTGDWRRLEREYWARFARALELDVPLPALIRASLRAIRPLRGPATAALLGSLRRRGVTLGVCSNNTAFWFRRQWDALRLGRFVDPRRAAVSCRVGAEKSSPRHEMFRALVARLRCEPPACVLVDDRIENVRRAREFGMSAIRFPSPSCPTVAALRKALDRLIA